MTIWLIPTIPTIIMLAMMFRPVKCTTDMWGMDYVVRILWLAPIGLTWLVWFIWLYFTS